MKLLNTISVIAGAIGGVIMPLLGGDDKIIRALIAVIVVDYITGLLKALYTRSLSSEIGFKGIIKKIMILCVVATSVVAGNSLNTEIPIHDMVIMFFLCNEVISICENAAVMLPLPQKFKDFFVQLRDKTGGQL